MILKNTTLSIVLSHRERIYKKWKKNWMIVIYTAHGYFYKNASLKRLIYYQIEKLMSKYKDALIIITN